MSQLKVTCYDGPTGENQVDSFTVPLDNVVEIKCYHTAGAHGRELAFVDASGKQLNAVDIGGEYNVVD